MSDTSWDAELMQTLGTAGRRGFAYAWQMLQHREDALDAVQAALTAVWQHRRRLDRRRDARGWFYRVLRNKCVDTIRRRGTRQIGRLDSDPPEREPHDPVRCADRDEQARHVRVALDELPSEMRDIILLRDFHDLSYAEIADVLGVPAGTVMSRLHRARATLRERLLAREAD